MDREVLCLGQHRMHIIDLCTLLRHSDLLDLGHHPNFHTKLRLSLEDVNIGTRTLPPRPPPKGELYYQE